jgi:hypothetical protein
MGKPRRSARAARFRKGGNLDRRALERLKRRSTCSRDEQALDREPFSSYGEWRANQGMRQSTPVQTRASRNFSWPWLSGRLNGRLCVNVQTADFVNCYFYF